MFEGRNNVVLEYIMFHLCETIPNNSSESELQLDSLYRSHSFHDIATLFCLAATTAITIFFTSSNPLFYYAHVCKHLI